LVLGNLPFRTRLGQYRKIHLTLNRKGASHLLFYRETAPRQLTIVRVLHERMDAAKHLAGEE
jgi:plasmid stabilization system protein ParE